MLRAPIAAYILLILLLFVSPGLAQDPNHTLRLTDASGPPGEERIVQVLLDHPGGVPIHGWSFGVCHDVTSLTLVEATLGTTAATANGGNPPDLHILELLPGGLASSLVIDFTGTNTLLPAPGHELLDVTYQLTGPLGTATTLDFCAGLGTPPVEILLVCTCPIAILPTTFSGSVLIGSGLPFLRGDASGDGTFDGLSDGLFVLNHQFIPGAPAPPCLDAADVDDDGQVSGLLDGVAALSFQFIPGSPPPPFPGPLDCGFDPTGDPLTCELYPSCP